MTQKRISRRALLAGAAATSAAAAVAALAAAITPIQNADTTATAGAQANDALSTPRMGTAQAQVTQTAVGGVTSTPSMTTATATSVATTPPSVTPTSVPSTATTIPPTKTPVAATNTPQPATVPPPTPTATPSGAQVSVRDYGAKGDGTTDDTAAIQAAITACPTNGTVFVPAGTYIVSVTPTAWIAIKSNITLLGASNSTATIKIRNGNGPFKNIFAPTGLGFIQHFTVSSLGFDTNLAGNGASAITDGDGSSYQTCVYAEDGNDLHVTGCLFRAHGLWEVAFNGQSITNCSINNNTVYYTHNLGTADYDNSCFYIDGTNYQINDNTFVATQGPGYARACTETHGGGVAGAQFLRNTSTGFQTILNLVGRYTAPASEVTNITADNNVANDAMQAFRLQPIQNGMDGVKIRNNTIHVTPLKFSNARGGGDDTYGISTLNDAETPAFIKNLTITGNTIDFPEAGTGDTANPYANCSGIGVINTAGADMVTITGNTITRAYGPAIKVGNPANTTNGFSHVAINGNTIVDAGANLAFPALVRDDIYVTSKCPNLTILSNVMSDDYPTRRTVHPIAINQATNSGAVYATQDVAYNTFNGAAVDVENV